MNKAEISFDRLSNIIKKDKEQQTGDAIVDLLKADIISILKNYFELNKDSAELEIDVKGANDINFYFAINISRIKDFYQNKGY